MNSHKVAFGGSTELDHCNHSKQSKTRTLSLPLSGWSYPYRFVILTRIWPLIY